MVRRCWTLRGLRPTVAYRTKYEWSYLYSALEVDGENAAQFLCLPGVSLALSGLFLEQLAARDPEAEHVVIWDQMGFHPQPQRHPLPARVHPIALPPYSPELNPVEIIGDLIKDQIANTLCTTLEALEEALGEELRPIYESAERVRKSVSHPWLVDQLNATAPENSAVTCYNSAITITSKSQVQWNGKTGDYRPYRIEAIVIFGEEDQGRHPNLRKYNLVIDAK